ncbi:MAG TPA: cation transporter [Lacipirellulaceae bacterium]|nr:cation transporter [Lacipirellulaceae bacterium]HMP07970.1 cation transporter [Lacipirellulaceae bacterium]
MHRSLLLLAAFAVSTESLRAEEPELVEATFLVTGLHCPPCTRTVEASIAPLPGVQSIVVDWKTKAAKVTFDPAATSAWSIVQRVSQTRHMMGGRLKYAAWLGLSVPELKDDRAAAAIKSTLQDVEGVAAVSVYPKQHIVAVLFDGKTEVEVEELMRAIKEAGYEAQLY